MALLDIRQRTGYLFLDGDARPRDSDLRAGEHTPRRAGASGRHVRPVRRGSARQLDGRVVAARRLDELRQPARRPCRERRLEGAIGRGAGSAAGTARARRPQQRAARDPGAARPLEPENDRRRGDRRWRVDGLQDGDDRQGDIRPRRPRHGGDGTERGGRPGRGAERAGGQSAAAHRPERRGGRVDRAVALARRGRSARATSCCGWSTCPRSRTSRSAIRSSPRASTGFTRRDTWSGTVEAVEKSGNSYKQILVRPAVDFSSVEEVLVVLTPMPGREAEESSQ